MKIEIKNLRDISPSLWAGGETKQLFILPEGLSVKDDFDIRISVATLFRGESPFTKFKGYNRILTLLSGEIELVQEQREITLKPMESFEFSGVTPISSKVKEISLDFNIIYKEKYSPIQSISHSVVEKYSISSHYIFVFSLENNGKIRVNEKEYIMGKYDFFIIKNEKNIVELSFLGTFLKCLI